MPYIICITYKQEVLANTLHHLKGEEKEHKSIKYNVKQGFSLISISFAYFGLIICIWWHDLMDPQGWFVDLDLPKKISGGLISCWAQYVKSYSKNLYVTCHYIATLCMIHIRHSKTLLWNNIFIKCFSPGKRGNSLFSHKQDYISTVGMGSEGIAFFKFYHADYLFSPALLSWLVLHNTSPTYQHSLGQ